MGLFGLIQVVRPTDTTDKSRLNRSGVSLYVDALTGCHYLSVQEGIFGKGVLIPRLDRIGQHYCEIDK